MLGRADAGYKLLIGNPIYISYLLFLRLLKPCMIRISTSGMS